MMDESLKRAIIMDHYTKPHNKGLKDDESYKVIHMASDSCIDDITVQVKVENDVVKDVRFDGVGCTIAFSSTSIMTDLVKNKKVDDRCTEIILMMGHTSKLNEERHEDRKEVTSV